MKPLTCFKACDIEGLLSTRIFLAGAILASLAFYAFGSMALTVLVAMGWVTRTRYAADFATKFGIGQQESLRFTAQRAPYLGVSYKVAHGV